MKDNNINGIDPTTGLPVELQNDLQKLGGQALYDETFSPNRTTMGPTDSFNMEEFMKRGVPLSNQETAEELRAQAQPWTEKWARGTTKFIGKTATAFAGGTLGTIAGLANVIGTGELSSFYDNGFQNWLDSGNEYLDKYNPNYYTKAEQEASLFKQMGTANFWANDFLGAMSFTAGAMLTEMAASAVMGPLGTALASARLAKAGQVAKVANNLKKYGRGADETLSALQDASKGIQQMDILRRLGKGARQIITGAGYEAGVEARHFINEGLANWEEQFVNAYGRQPNDQERMEAEAELNGHANAVFGLNLGLVSIGNAAVLPKTFGFGMERAQNIGDIAKTAKGFEAAADGYSKSRNIMRRTIAGLKAPIGEGIVEEGGQGVISTGLMDFAMKSLDPNNLEEAVSLSESMIEGLEETFTGEGLKEVLIGALVGAFGGGNPVTGGAIGNIREQMAQDQNARSMAEFMNSNGILEATKANFNNAAAQLAISEEMANPNTTELEMERLKDEAFYIYTLSRIRGGYGSEIESEIREQIESLTEDEFRETYNMPDLTDEEVKEKKSEIIQKATDKTRRIKDAFKTAQRLDTRQNEFLQDGLGFGIARLEDIETNSNTIAMEISNLMGNVLTPESIEAVQTAQAVIEAGLDGKDVRGFKNSIRAYKGVLTKYKKQLKEGGPDAAQKVAETEKLLKEKEDKIATYLKALEDKDKVAYDKLKVAGRDKNEFIRELAENMERLDNYMENANIVDKKEIEDRREKLDIYAKESYRLANELEGLFTPEGQKQFEDTMQTVFDKVTQDLVNEGKRLRGEQRQVERDAEGNVIETPEDDNPDTPPSAESEESAKKDGSFLKNGYDLAGIWGLLDGTLISQETLDWISTKTLNNLKFRIVVDNYEDGGKVKDVPENSDYSVKLGMDGKKGVYLEVIDPALPASDPNYIRRVGGLKSPNRFLDKATGRLVDFTNVVNLKRANPLFVDSDNNLTPRGQRFKDHYLGMKKLWDELIEGKPLNTIIPDEILREYVTLRPPSGFIKYNDAGSPEYRPIEERPTLSSILSDPDRKIDFKFKKEDGTRGGKNSVILGIGEDFYYYDEGGLTELDVEEAEEFRNQYREVVDRGRNNNAAPVYVSDRNGNPQVLFTATEAIPESITTTEENGFINTLNETLEYALDKIKNNKDGRLGEKLIIVGKGFGKNKSKFPNAVLTFVTPEEQSLTAELQLVHFPSKGKQESMTKLAYEVNTKGQGNVFLVLEKIEVKDGKFYLKNSPVPLTYEQFIKVSKEVFNAAPHSKGKKGKDKGQDATLSILSKSDFTGIKNNPFIQAKENPDSLRLNAGFGFNIYVTPKGLSPLKKYQEGYTAPKPEKPTKATKSAYSISERFKGETLPYKAAVYIVETVKEKKGLQAAVDLIESVLSGEYDIFKENGIKGNPSQLQYAKDTLEKFLTIYKTELKESPATEEKEGNPDPIENPEERSDPKPPVGENPPIEEGRDDLNTLKTEYKRLNSLFIEIAFNEEFQVPIEEGEDSYEVQKQKIESQIQDVIKRTKDLGFSEDDLKQAPSAFATNSRSKVRGQAISRAKGFQLLRSLLPESVISTAELETISENLRNSNTPLALFWDNVIYLSKNPPVTVVYHEAFHAVFRTFLTNAQREKLYTKARQSFGRPTNADIGRIRLRDASYFNLSRIELTRLWYEEKMAHEFERYVYDKKSLDKNWLRRVFKKILKFLGFVKQKESDFSILFDNIIDGEYSGAVPSPDKFMLGKNRAAALLETEIAGIPSKVSANKTNKIINAATISALHKLREAQASGKEGTEKLFEEVIGQAIQEIKARYSRDTWSTYLKDIVANMKSEDPEEANLYKQKFSHISKSIMQYEKIFDNLNNYNIIEKEVSNKLRAIDFTGFMTEEEIEAKEQETNLENFDNSPFLLGSWNKLSSELKALIALTTVYEDEFGFSDVLDIEVEGNPNFKYGANADAIYGILDRGLVNVSRNNFNERLYQLAQDNTNLNAFYKNLENFILNELSNNGIEANEIRGLSYDVLSANSLTFNKLVKAFNNYQYNKIDISVDPNTGLTVLNKSSLANNVNDQKENWLTNFQLNPIPKVLVQDAFENIRNWIDKAEITDRYVNKIVKEFKSVGISISPIYVKYSMISGRVDELGSTGKGITEDNNPELFALYKSFENLEPITNEDLTVLYNATKSSNENTNLFYAVQFDKDTGDLIVGTGASKVLTKLAYNNAQVDETVVNSTMQNVEGENEWDRTTSTYLVDVLRVAPQLNRQSFAPEASTQDLIDEFAKFDIFIREQDAPFYKLFLENNPILEDNIGIAVSGGIRATNLKFNNGRMRSTIFGPVREKAATFKHSDVSSRLLTEFALFTTAIPGSGNEGKNRRYFNLGINSEKSTNYLVEASKKRFYDADAGVTNSAIQYFKNLIQAEFNRIRSIQTSIDNGTAPEHLNYAEGSARGLRLNNFRNFPDEAKFIKDAKEGNPINDEILEDAIRTYLDGQLDNFMNLLQSPSIRIIREKEGLKSSVLPKYFYHKDGETVNEAKIKDFYLNAYLIPLAANDFVHGDPAMKFKNIENRFKRAGGNAASGPHFGSGRTKVSVIPAETIQINDENLQAEVDRTDGQSWSTPIWYVNTYLTKKGVLYPEVKSIVKKILTGQKISNKEARLLGKLGADFRSRKLVQKDLTSYLKTSTAPLVRELTSIPKYSKEEMEARLDAYLDGNLSVEDWVDSFRPKKGREELHSKLNRMMLSGTDILIVDSGSKEAIPKLSTETEYYPYEFANNTIREQVATDNDKNQIVDGKQKMHLIFSEVPNDSKVTINGSEHTVGHLRDQYFLLLADRVRQGYELKREDLFGPGNDNMSKPLYNKILNVFKNNLELSSQDPFLQEMLETDSNGEPRYNLNIPTISNRVEAMFISHMSKNTYQQKRAGAKFTLLSDSGFTVTDSTTGKQRRLAHRLQEEDGTYYSEALISPYVLDKLGLKVGDTVKIDSEKLKMLGVRIPTDDFHSMVSIKIVGFLPNVMGNSIVLPAEIIPLSGADFDIDALYASAYHFRDNEKLGKYLTIEDDNEAYQRALKEAKGSGIEITKSQVLNNRKFYKKGQYSNIDYITRGELNNLLLDIEYQFVNVNEDAAYRQTSTEIFEDTIKILEDNGVDMSINTTGFSSPSDRATFNASVIAGSENIGVAARANTLLSYLMEYNISLTDALPYINLSETGNTTIDKYSKRDIASQIIQAMVDNPTLNYAGMFNLNVETTSLLSSLVSLGFNPIDALLMMKQPGMELIVQYKGFNNRTIKSTKDTEFYDDDAIADELLKEFGTDGENELPPVQINRQNLIEGITNPESATSRRLQLQIGHLFRVISKDVNEKFQALSTIINLNGKQGTSFAEVEKVNRAMKALGIKPVYKNIKEIQGGKRRLIQNLDDIDFLILEDEDGPISRLNNIDKLIENPFVKRMLQMHVAFMEDSSKFFINQTEFFKGTEGFVSDLGNPGIYSKKARAKLKNELMNFLTMKAFSKMYRGEIDITDPSVLFDESFISDLTKLREAYPDNKFLNFINIKQDKKIFGKTLVEILGNTRTKGSYDYQVDLSNAFAELYLEGNADAIKFTRKIIKYLLVKDNLAFKNGSIVKQLHPLVFKHISKVLDQIQDLGAKKVKTLDDEGNLTDLSYKEVFGTTQYGLKQEFIEKFFRYKPNNYLLVGKKPQLTEEDTFYKSTSTGFIFKYYNEKQRNALQEKLKFDEDKYTIHFPYIFKMNGVTYKLNLSGTNRVAYEKGFYKHGAPYLKKSKDVSGKKFGLVEYIKADTVSNRMVSPYSIPMSTLEYMEAEQEAKTADNKEKQQEETEATKTKKEEASKNVKDVLENKKETTEESGIEIKTENGKKIVTGLEDLHLDLDINFSLVSNERQITIKEGIKILQKLSKKFNIEYVLDTSLKSLGEYNPKENKVYINPNKMKADTPFHEFAHPFIRVIKKKNPALYKNLIMQIRKENSIFAEVAGKYTNYFKGKGLSEKQVEDALLEEAIVTAIGKYSAATQEEIANNGLYSAIAKLLRRITKYIFSLIDPLYYAGIKNQLPTITAETIAPNTTLQELGFIMNLDNTIQTNIATAPIIKPGVTELFESNPQLASIGTATEYSAYLDTIFPDSKVKDIAYHGSKSTLFNTKYIKDKFGKFIFSTKDKEYADTYSKRSNGRTFQVVNNIKNPFSVSELLKNKNSSIANRFKNFLKLNKGNGYDLNDYLEANSNSFTDLVPLTNRPFLRKFYEQEGFDSLYGWNEIVVFEPEQIHILGSKQDMERFKKWTENNPMPTNDIFENLVGIEKIC